MRCLHCGKRLALLRKLTSGEFCSDHHRREYEEGQQILAMSRLAGHRKAAPAADGQRLNKGNGGALATAVGDAVRLAETQPVQEAEANPFLAPVHSRILKPGFSPAPARPRLQAAVSGLPRVTGGQEQAVASLQALHQAVVEAGAGANPLPPDPAPFQHMIPLAAPRTVPFKRRHVVFGARAFPLRTAWVSMPPKPTLRPGLSSSIPVVWLEPETGQRFVAPDAAGAVELPFRPALAAPPPARKRAKGNRNVTQSRGPADVLLPGVSRALAAPALVFAADRLLWLGPPHPQDSPCRISIEPEWEVVIPRLMPASPLQIEKLAAKQHGTRTKPAASGWSHWGQSWAAAPADLKWLTLALPLVLGLAGYSLLPQHSRGRLPAPGTATEKNDPAPAAPRVLEPREQSAARELSPERPAVHSAPPVRIVPAVATSTASEGAPQGYLKQMLTQVQQTITSRAAIALRDDFRDGLKDWEGRGNWEQSWRVDRRTGFVQPGAFAIYKPSAAMADYRFEMLGQVDRQGLNWAVRAQDERNYDAMRMVVNFEAQPVSATLVRFTVRNGREGSHKRIAVPLPPRGDSLFRIAVEVQGDTVLTAVQGQLVDVWTESQLKQGGIALFGVRGDQSGIRFVDVSHQVDTLGRLCAYLAPVDLQARAGAWK